MYKFPDPTPTILFHLRQRACRRICHHNLLLTQIRHPGLRTTLLPAQIVIRRIHRQPVQPRFKYFGFPQLIQGMVQSQKNLLADILHVLTTINQSRYRTQDPTTIRLHYLAESRVVSLPRLFNQRKVNEHGGLHPRRARRLTADLINGYAKSGQIVPSHWGGERSLP